MTTPLMVVTWKWKRADGTELFTAKHVNTLRSMLDRHLHRDHRLLCLTDDQDGLDGDILTWPIQQFTDTPRCLRRMAQYSRHFAQFVGDRFFSLDLDTVIVDDITPLVNRDDALVAYWIDYARVFSGSLILMSTGYLDPLFEMFAADPEGFPAQVKAPGVVSDQAMLNWYLQRTRPPMGIWTERDGIILYFGKGYERYEHRGVGPNRPTLPACARLVAFGSADLDVLNRPTLPFIVEHYR